MILPAQWIEAHGPDIISPYNPSLVNPASYDVTLDNKIIVRGDESTVLPIVMMPQEFLIASTQEYFTMPNDVAGDLKLKSTIGRMGINHTLSGWIDPGFSGNITLELQNVSGARVELRAGMKIAQLVFVKLLEPTALPYGLVGRYFGQSGPTMARPEKARTGVKKTESKK